MSKWYLFSKLAQEGNMATTIRNSKGEYIDGIVLSVGRESGDGKSFNVVLIDSKGNYRTEFVRTID